MRLARAAAGVTTERVAAVCGLTDQDLRKHLRNLPARGRCAATVAALAAAQRAPEGPHSAAVAHRACPPPAVRAAWLTDLEAVTAAKGSASWTLGLRPHRGDSIDLYMFSHTPRLHRSVMIGLAVATDDFYRQGIAQNPLCPSAILERLAQDPDEGVRGRCNPQPAKMLLRHAVGSDMHNRRTSQKIPEGVRGAPPGSP